MNLSSNESVAFQLKKTIAELNRLNEQKEEVDQKCKVLNKKVNELQEERASLINDIEILKNKLQQEDNARVDPNNDMNKQLRLQQKLDSMQEELYKLESEKEKFRVQFAAAKAEQDILIEKNIELKRVAQEHQNLKDEIDILKHTSDKVEKLESSIENYKIKLEEMADLKKQMKSQENNNAANLEKLFVMEEEVKKIATLKSQIDMYKKQIQELHEKILGDETKMKKMEYEYKDIEEACCNLKQEKEKIQSEYERLKDSHDKLEFNEAINSENNAKKHSQPDENSSSSFMDGLFSNVELVNISNETKEKIIRLYHENKFLKLKQNELTDERLMILQTQYDDEQMRTKDLQQKLAEVTNQKIELECKLNSTSISSNVAKESDQELKTLISRLQSQLDEESKKNKKFEQNIEYLNSEKNKIVENKEKEIQDLNDKYRSYLEKAKIVIKSLDPLKSSQNLSEDQLLVLKNQLAEKDKHIKQLNKDIERLKSSRMQEEELIASAWYTLGSQLNRRATDERIATIGNSFLSQQRHLQPSGSSSSSVVASGGSNQTSSSSSSSLILNSSNRMRANGSYKSMLNSSVSSVNAQSNQTASATS
jgi:protein HOOK3